MSVIRINERTRFRLEIGFLDGSLHTPPTVARWRVSCDTTNTDLTDWATLSVPSNGIVEIEIPASLMRIISSSNSTEDKVISVEAEPGTDSQVSEEQWVKVKNLRKTS